MNFPASRKKCHLTMGGPLEALLKLSGERSFCLALWFCFGTFLHISSRHQAGFLSLEIKYLGSVTIMSVFEPWKKDLRFALQTGLLDQRADIIQARAIEGLLNGDPRLIMSSSDAFSMGIEDYIEKCEVIGELESWNATTSTEIDCSLSSIVTVIRGTPRASLLHSSFEGTERSRRLFPGA